MIKFKRLDITSFKSIFHCTIDFDDLSGQLYLLEGKNNTVDFASSNGAGKSTILSALTYALYGSTDDSTIKKADYQNKSTKIKLKLILDLDIQDTSYVIERTDKELKLYKNGEDISELTKTDTEKKFQSILKLTKSEFCNFTYLSQNGSGSFLTKTPSEKLNCIKDFIFGEDLKLIDTQLNNYIKETKSITSEYKDQCIAINSSINTLKDILSHKDDEIEKFPYSLEEYEKDLVNLENKRREYNKLQNTVHNFESQISNYKQKFSKVKQNYEKAKENICPTCGQTLKDKTVLSSLAKEAKEIKDVVTDIKQQRLNAETELSKLENLNYDVLIKDIYTIIAKIKQQDKNKQNFDDIANELESKTKKLTAAMTLEEEFDFKLQQLNKLYKYFKTDFIQYIQKAFLCEIENYLNLYCHDIFDEDFKLIFSNNSLELTIGGQPYNYFSGGEKQRIDFIFVFAIKVALSSFTDKCTNLFICDESLSGQDSEAFENCLELISSLTSAEDLTTILVSHRDVDYQLNKIIIERFYDKTKLNIIEV